MTRHEQILSEVQKRFSSNDTHLVSKINAFVDGVKWADKNPEDRMVNLDKVEKYLRENIILYVWATDLDKREEWFRDFRKVMEK